MAAKREDWNAIPLPAARQALEIDRRYSPEEFARVSEGRIPREMEDKWFVFYEEPWLYLHRSWTGFCVFQVRFEREPEGVRIAEALANRDPEQYRVTDATRDAQLLSTMIDGYAGRSTIDAMKEDVSRPRR